jgi:hypothetical protein
VQPTDPRADPRKSRPDPTLERRRADPKRPKTALSESKMFQAFCLFLANRQKTALSKLIDSLDK